MQRTRRASAHLRVLALLALGSSAALGQGRGTALAIDPLDSISTPELRLVVRVDDGSGVEVERALNGQSGWNLLEQQKSVEESGTSLLEMTLEAVDAPIRAHLRYESYPGSTAVRSVLDVTNQGSLPLTLVSIDSAFRRFPTKGPARLLWIPNFTWSQPDLAFVPQEEVLQDGADRRIRMGPYGTAAAWFALRSGRGGLFGGWEWSGTGEMRFTAENGGVTVGLGLSGDSFSRQLGPGETFTAPPAFIGTFNGTFEDAGAATRALVDRRLALPLPYPDFPPVGFDTWGYSLDIDQGLVHDVIDRAADLGVEEFTIDAGWAQRLGDWVPLAGRFDDGIEPLAEHVHARGMKFGMWIAFGSAEPESAIAREHPELLARRNGAPILGDFNGWALCLADPRARAWVLAELDRVIDTYHLDWLVHDFQVIVPCDDPSHGHQRTDGDFATTAGYYEVLDELRRRHPKLILECCWDGGAMVDFGMVRRHHTVALNDRCDADGNRRATYGASFLLPNRYLEKYVGDDGNPAAYRFMSGVPGGAMLMMGRPTEWDEATSDAARRSIATFKALRSLNRDGTLSRLASPPGEPPWEAFVTSDPVRGESAIVTFTGQEVMSDGFVLKPRGLSWQALYDVSWGVDDAAATQTLPGFSLATQGLHVMLVGARETATIVLSKLAP